MDQYVVFVVVIDGRNEHLTLATFNSYSMALHLSLVQCERGNTNSMGEM